MPTPCTAPADAVEVTVVICTCNRQPLLARTLDSLAASRADPALRWEVLVVDNNSTDGTRRVVESRASGYPVPLRWRFEARQGKAHALGTGIAASTSPILLFTDDDVLIPAGWVDAAVAPLLARDDIDYTGGPALPDWEAPPPAWIHGDPRRLWGPIALLDYGTEPFIFEERGLVAMGVNMAVRRRLIERVGGFHPLFERTGASLMGQGQVEFFFRTRAAGARGLYVPAMALRHYVPAARLTRRYYRRWWYWKGVARARMADLHPVSEEGLDVRTTPQIGRVPRYMFGAALRRIAGWMTAALRGDTVRRAEHEMSLLYIAGYARARVSSSPRLDAALQHVSEPSALVAGSDQAAVPFPSARAVPASAPAEQHLAVARAEDNVPTAMR